MTTEPNELKDLMRAHNLRCKQVALLLNRSEKSVRNWRCSSGPSIPTTLLELLRLKLQQGEQTQGSAA